jgi:hypothetical protein
MKLFERAFAVVRFLFPEFYKILGHKKSLLFMIFFVEKLLKMEKYWLRDKLFKNIPWNTKGSSNFIIKKILF